MKSSLSLLALTIDIIMFDLTFSVSFILLIVFAITFIINQIYYLGIFSKLAFYKSEGNETGNMEPVSIVICARNEEFNLRKYLSVVLSQEYPKFEVIVVNDHSEDNTIFLLKDLAELFPNLEIVDLNLEDEQFAKGKKFPLTLGIKRAKYNQLLLTDADCIPSSNQWLRLMQRNFTSKKEIVLGYGPLLYTGGLLNLLIRVDSFLVAVKYLSFSLVKNTYMGVGRNLAYKKNLFFDNKGFASHYHIASGDDDLFINEVARPTNTAIEVDPESFVFSETKKTFNQWVRQKKRHLTTGPIYRRKIKFLLSTFFLNDLLFYFLMLVFLIAQYNLIIVGSIFIIRYIINVIILSKAVKRLNEKKMFIGFLPLYEAFYLFYYTFIVIINKTQKQKTWS